MMEGNIKLIYNFFLNKKACFQQTNQQPLNPKSQ